MTKNTFKVLILIPDHDGDGAGSVPGCLGETHCDPIYVGVDCGCRRACQLTHLDLYHPPWKSDWK